MRTFAWGDDEDARVTECAAPADDLQVSHTGHLDVVQVLRRSRHQRALSTVDVGSATAAQCQDMLSISARSRETVSLTLARLKKESPGVSRGGAGFIQAARGHRGNPHLETHTQVSVREFLCSRSRGRRRPLNGAGSAPERRKRLRWGSKKRQGRPHAQRSEDPLDESQEACRPRNSADATLCDSPHHLPKA